MKKMLWIFLSLLLLVSVTGCSRSRSNGQPASAQNGTNYISAQQAREIALAQAEKQ